MCVYIVMHDSLLLLLLLIIIISSSSVIIITTTITVRQDIYNYIPETNNISGVYSVAAVLYSRFVVHTLQFPMIPFVLTHQYFLN